MMPGQRTSMNRRALTLIELLVVIGIIGLLAGLLLPAVQSAREAARRARCGNNLGQLMRATHLFESTNGGFPPALTMGHPPVSNKQDAAYSAQVRLLPFLEQIALYNSINFAVPTGNSIKGLQRYHNTEATRILDVFLCPSDPNISLPPLAPISYRACTGLGTMRKSPAGMSFGHDGGLFEWRDNDGQFLKVFPVSEVTDGLSNTLAFTEKAIGSGVGSVYSPFRDWSQHPFDDRILAPDDWVNACTHVTTPSPRLEGGGSWMLPGAIYTHFYASVAPNTLIPDCGIEMNFGTGIFAARAYHPGGVNAAMGDGSVRWASSGTAQNVWRAMGTRAGGEVISD